ncbi:MAG TPA: LptA/OstA family protein [Rhodopila sp.]|nr:LptA/OstA family protein [Rhodopila sp.]
MTAAPRSRRLVSTCLAAVTALGLAGLCSARAQQLDLTHGGPIDITAQDGIEWRQADQEVIARGNAKAVRDNVTVTADRLTAWYRKKKSGAAPVQPAAQPASPTAGLAADADTEDNEIYRLQADGNVRIFTQTDQAQGDKAVYDLDQAVMVMTGRNLKLTTPNDVITARDDLEYWPQKHMAVARGDAVVVTNDAKRVAADTLVAYTTDNPTPNGAPTPAATSKAPTDPLGASGKLQRVEAFGHVSIRTPTDTVTGDRGVYVPDTGMARLAGNVQINRGQNQLNGAEADVNMKTGIATLISARSDRVHGLVVPNDATNKGLASDSAVGGAAGPAKGQAGGKPAAPAGGKKPGETP